MTPEKIVLKNTLAATTGRGIDSLLAFVFFVWFSRIFGSVVLGKYAFAMSLAGLLCVAINLGLNNLMVREVSRDRTQSSSYVGTLLVTQGVLALVIWIAIWTIAWALPFDSVTAWILGILGTYHVFLRLSLIFSASFRAHEEMKFSAGLLVLHRTVILAFGIPVMLVWQEPLLTLASFPIGTVVMFVAGYLLCRKKYGSPDLRVNLPVAKRALVAGMPFFAMIFLLQLHDRVGVILLSFFESDPVVGAYSAAERILVTIGMVFQIFGGALLPALSRLSAQSRETARALYRKSILTMLFVAVPLALLLALLSEQIIMITFGGSFEGAIQVLRVLSISLVFVALNQAFLGFLIAEYHERAVAWIRSGAVGLHVLLSLLLIPNFSSIGLAYAHAISMASLTVALWWFVVKRVDRVDS